VYRRLIVRLPLRDHRLRCHDVIDRINAAESVKRGPHRWRADRRKMSSAQVSLSGGMTMPLYMYEIAYTAESLAAQVKDPKDRLEVVKPVLEAAGAKLIVGGYAFGDYDVVAIYEAPDDTAAAAIALAFGAGGAARSGRTTKLLTGQEWIASLRKAQSLQPQYRPAR
jgi:uncharacterized protein with GYD domain